MGFLASLSLYSRTMLGVCAALLLIILTEVTLLSGDSSAETILGETPDPGVATTGTMPQSLQIPPVIAYREVKERPLFSDTRRSPPKAAAGNNATQVAQLATKWKVTGIVMAGDDSFALVEGIRDRKTIRLLLGMPLDGWKLEEVYSDHLVFSAADTSATLQLHAEKPAQARQRR